jgi:hypothetical protein
MKEHFIAIGILTVIFSVALGIIALYIVNNDDVRLGFKSTANEWGFNFDLEEELKPRPPRIGFREGEVERYCGYPDESRSYETARATIVTTRYKNSDKSECIATFTFVNEKLDSIAKTAR